jgi:hypothetical protein
VLKLVKLNYALVPANKCKANISIKVNESQLLKFIRPTKIDIFLFCFSLLSFVGAYLNNICLSINYIVNNLILTYKYNLLQKISLKYKI